jgi:hypothetical protein
MLYEHMRSRISGSALEQRRALVLGAGDAGRLLVAGLQHTQGWVIVGFLDDALEKQGARVAGVPVLGRLEQAGEYAAMHGITHLIVAMPGATVPQRRHALDVAGEVGLPVLTVPSSDELLSGRSVNQVRDIEPEDLLGREPVELDEGGISECLNGKVVLITGAGGSIGSELCRQVARYGPSRIVLYELSEFALYTIEQELAEKFPQLPLVRLIGDVKDLEHLRHVFGKYEPQIVFHAAAYKHVPLMEDENAWAALRNNTLGTYHACLALCADQHGQSGQPDQCDGCHQTRGGIGDQPHGRPRPRNQVHGGTLRQRAWVQRQRDPEVQGADCQGWAGDGHPSGDHALLHDHPGGGASRRSGGGDRGVGAGLRAGHGRAGEDLEFGPSDDPDERQGP